MLKEEIAPCTLLDRHVFYSIETVVWGYVSLQLFFFYGYNFGTPHKQNCLIWFFFWIFECYQAIKIHDEPEEYMAQILLLVR